MSANAHSRASERATASEAADRPAGYSDKNARAFVGVFSRRLEFAHTPLEMRRSKNALATRVFCFLFLFVSLCFIFAARSLIDTQTRRLDAAAIDRSASGSKRDSLRGKK